MKMSNRLLARVAGALLVTAVAASASAQTYPTKPITIILPFGPGGGGDLLSRIVSTRMEQLLGQPVIIETRPGGGGTIGSNIVAKSAPDGYTLLAATSTPLGINATLLKSLPYDPANDFIPIADFGRVPWVLVVTPSLPVKNVEELIAYAKAHPGALSFGSSGVGTPAHLFMEVFKKMTGTDMIHVPYKGIMPAIGDTVAGHLQVLFCDAGPCRGQIDAGGVRTLGIATGTRFPTLPDVPPINQVGVPGFDLTSWQMLFVPAKTPPQVIARLHAVLKSILDQPEVKEQIIKAGFTPVDSRSVEEMHAFVKADIPRWGRMVREVGIAGSQ